MLKAKVLAMCVCPAVVAPPAIIAFHPPARHAVAHALHRAANRLDRSSAPTRQLDRSLALAAVPCLPTLAGDAPSGAALAGIGALAGGGDFAPARFVAPGAPGAGFGGGLPGDGGAAYGGGSGYAGGGGGYLGNGGGGYLGGGGGASIAGPTSSAPAPVAPGTAAPVSGAPEPAAWVFLVIGFGLVGAIARRAGPTTAAARRE